MVGVETAVRSSITCATICPILHFDNFTMRSFRSPIGAVEHHDLLCAELAVNSHGAAASPAMMTYPSSGGGVRLDQTVSVDGCDTSSLGASIFRGSGAPVRQQQQQ